MNMKMWCMKGRARCCTWPNIHLALLMLPKISNMPARMQVVIPHSHDAQLEDFEVFDGHLAVLRRVNGLGTISIFNLSESAVGPLGIIGQEPMIVEDSGEDTYTLQFGEQGPFNSSMLRLTFSSLTTPQSTYDVNMATGKPLLALHTIHIR